MQVLIPENVRSRVDSYDWLVSLVIMPVGFAVAGPLAASVGFTATLVAAAIVLSVPCALVVLVPGRPRRAPERGGRDRRAGDGR